MARGRMISNSLGSSRRFADLRKAGGKLGEFAQSLYPLLVSNTDDFGRQSGDSFTVKHKVFPVSARSEREFEAALVAMATVGLVVRYETPRGLCVQISSFDEHQQNLHRRTKSKFPEPPTNAVSATPSPDLKPKDNDSSNLQEIFPEIPGTSGNFPEIQGNTGPRELNLREPNLQEKKETDVVAKVGSCNTSRDPPDDDDGDLLKQITDHPFLGQILDPVATLHKLKLAFPEINPKREMNALMVDLSEGKVREHRARGRHPERTLLNWFSVADQRRRAEAQGDQYGSGRSGRGESAPHGKATAGGAQTNYSEFEAREAEQLRERSTPTRN